MVYFWSMVEQNELPQMFYTGADLLTESEE